MQSLKIIQPYNLNINVRFFANGIIFLAIIIPFLNINILKVNESFSTQIVSKNLMFKSFDPQKVLNKNYASIFKNRVVLKHSLLGVANKDKKSIVVQETGKVELAKPKQVKKTFITISKVKSPVVIKETSPVKVTPKPSPKPVETLPTPTLPKAVEQPKVNTDGLFPAKKGKINYDAAIGSNLYVDDNGNEGQPDENVIKGGTYEGSSFKNRTKGSSGKRGISYQDDDEENKPLLNSTGWTWTSRINVKDDSDEIGIMRFNIQISSDGEIIGINTVSSSVSPELVQKYKRAICRTKFTPIDDTNKPEITKATITIRLNPK